MYVRGFRWPHEEINEDGGEGSGAPASGEAGQGEDGAGGESNDHQASQAAEKPAGDEPKTMLEAIERGLKTGEKQAEKTAAGDQKTPQQKQAEQKPAAAQDDDLSKPPEGISEGAKARFEKLVGRVKETSQQLEQTQSELHEVRQTSEVFSSFVRDTGVSGEQFGVMAQYLKAVNSGDFETAQNIIVSELKSISTRTGKEIDFGSQADPLSDHPDLKEAVESYQLTRAHALELVRTRAMQQQAEFVNQRQQQTDQQKQDWVGKKDAALADVGKWSSALKKTDLDYAPLEKIIAADNGPLQQIMQNNPPERWLPELQMIYNQMKAARGTVRSTAGGGPRPLSGAGGMPQGSTVVPKSMFDAMWAQRN